MVPPRKTQKARPKPEPTSTTLQAEQIFLARLAALADPKKILAGQKKAEDCLRKIAAEGFSPEYIHSSKLGITLQQLVNKCRRHTQLAPLGSLVHKILLKIKAEVNSILFGEEEYVSKPELAECKKGEPPPAEENCAREPNLHPNPTHKELEKPKVVPEVKESARAKEQSDQNESKRPSEQPRNDPKGPKDTKDAEDVKDTKDPKEFPTTEKEEPKSQKIDGVEEGAGDKAPKDPALMASICQELAKLLEEVEGAVTA